MGSKTHIDNTTGNQPGNVETLASAMLREGVHDLARGDLAVTGTAGLSVDVAKGECFTENDSYVYGNMSQKFFSSSFDSTTSVAISSNSSGNPRIDLICVKVDTAVSPGVQGVNASSIVAIAGTPAASPSAPAVPSNHLVLAQVAVANGASSITNGNITDKRMQAAIRQFGGWEYFNDNGAYQSADSPSFVIRFASVDYSSILSAGMRIRLKQGGSYKYFIITKVSFSTNTDVTVYGGTDYTLTNAAITDLWISSQKSPLGFPMAVEKWTVETSDTSNYGQAAPAQNTWYNKITFDVPIGSWEISYRVLLSILGNTGGSTGVRGFVTMSATTSEDDTKMTSGTALSGASSTTLRSTVTVTARKNISLTTKTTYNINVKQDQSSVPDSMTIAGSTAPTVLRAVCALL